MAKNARCDMQRLLLLHKEDIDNEAIESLVLRPYDTTKSAVQTNITADKTVWAALNFRKLGQDLFSEEQTHIIEETVVYETLVEKINNAISSLRPREKNVVELFYFKNLTTQQVADTVKYGLSHSNDIRYNAEAKLCRMISLDAIEKDYLIRVAEKI
jgi:DNA-directed RNA polymerase specialized sigma subunit